MILPTCEGSAIDGRQSSGGRNARTTSNNDDRSAVAAHPRRKPHFNRHVGWRDIGHARPNAVSHRSYDWPTGCRAGNRVVLILLTQRNDGAAVSRRIDLNSWSLSESVWQNSQRSEFEYSGAGYGISRRRHKEAVIPFSSAACPITHGSRTLLSTRPMRAWRELCAIVTPGLFIFRR